MTTLGMRDAIALLPPLVLSGCVLTNADSSTTSLAECRIAGKHDAQYGTEQWVPRLDGKPFAIIFAGDTKESISQPNRTDVSAQVRVFIALQDARTTAWGYDLDDLASAWADEMRRCVATNRMLGSGGAQMFGAFGDLRWVLTATRKHLDVPQTAPALKLKNVDFCGVLCETLLTARVSTPYQVPS